MHNKSIERDFRCASAPAERGSPVIRFWSEDKSKDGAQDFPDEIETPDVVVEGAKRTVTINCYERDKSARSKCIKECEKRDRKKGTVYLIHILAG